MVDADAGMMMPDFNEKGLADYKGIEIENEEIIPNQPIAKYKKF